MRPLRFFAFVVPLGIVIAGGHYALPEERSLFPPLSFSFFEQSDESATRSAEIGAAAPDSARPAKNYLIVAVGSARVIAERAETPEKQRQGLSGRESLPENGGMLFRYQAPGRYSFWMKDMRFSLDFIWIADGRVVGLTENVSPDTFPQAIGPEHLVTDVLEVSAGFVERHGIRMGDNAIFEQR